MHNTTTTRDVALRIFHTDNAYTDYVADNATVKGDILATSGGNSIFRITFTDVPLAAGNNTFNIAGKNDWTLDFLKLAIVKSEDAGVLPEATDFIHNPHILRSDSAVPGYCTDVTKIDLTTHDKAYYTEHFERADFDCGYAWNYDWDADANQMNVLLAAAKASGTDFLAEAFSNSPPYFMTVSGCSSGNEKESTNNLREDSYTAFANYMADVMEHWQITEDKIAFQSATPMNEPDTVTNYWTAHSNKQEGCHFSKGAAQSKILVELKKALKAKGLDDVILSASDETSIDYTIDSYKALTDDAKAVVTRIDTHTYGGSKRAELKALAESAGTNLWMSEVDGSYMAGTSAGEMEEALGLANAIKTDLNGMMPSAWILWNAIDQHSDSTKINLYPKSENDFASMADLYAAVAKSENENKGYWGIAFADHDNQKIVLTQKYYGYGQFSRYIRPGYTLIASSDNTVAAYDAKNQKVVIVAINTEGSDKKWKFSLSDFTTMGSEIKAIRTSGTLADGEHWADVSATDNIQADTAEKSFTATVKANSITTYIVENAVYDTAAETIASIDKVSVYAVDGLPATLPDTVTVMTSKNNKKQKEVIWDTTDVDLTKKGTVTGHLAEDEDTSVTASITEVSETNIQYLIDCNNPDSTNYPEKNAYAELYNEVYDKAYTEGTWGYVGSYGNYDQKNEASNMYAGGWYANENTITYKLPLDIGNYKIKIGLQEWWGDKTRKMDVSVAMEDGVETKLGTTSTYNGNNHWNTPVYDYTVEKAGTATITLTKAADTYSKPTLAFIQIQHILSLDTLKAQIQAAQALDTTDFSDSKKKALNKLLVEAEALMVKAATTQEDVDEKAAEIKAYRDAGATGFTEAEIAANDYVLYLVDCGSGDSTKVPEGYTLGLYQSVTNQQVAKDVITGLTWGYAAADANSKMVDGGKADGTLTGNYVYMADSGVTYLSGTSGFTYSFELPDRANQDYEVTVGIKNPWDTRTLDVVLEEKTVADALSITKGEMF